MQRRARKRLRPGGRPQTGASVVGTIWINALQQEVACQLHLQRAITDEGGLPRMQMPAEDRARDRHGIERGRRNRADGREGLQTDGRDSDQQGGGGKPEPDHGGRPGPDLDDTDVDGAGRNPEDDQREELGVTAMRSDGHGHTTETSGRSPAPAASLRRSRQPREEPMTRQLKPEDLYSIRLVDDPQISPEGERIAYVVTAIDRETYDYKRSIWIVPAKDGTPRRYTAGDNDTHPRWSPDGTRLAFVRGPLGDVKPKNKEERDRGVGKPQLWVLPADGGEARQLTWLRDGAGDPTWSPESATIIFTAEIGQPDDPEAADAQLDEKRVPAVRTIDRLWHRLDGKGWIYERRSHLFRIPVSGGDPEQLTDGDWDDGSPAYSPDGRRVAFTSDRAEERWTWPGNDVWVLELASKRLTRLTDERVFAGPPAWSSDGRQLAFAASPRREAEGYTDLLVVDVDRPGSARRLTEDFSPTFDDSCIDDQRAGHGGPYLYWTIDGKTIYSQASGRGSTLVYATPSEGGTPRAVIDGQRRIYGLTMDRDRRRVAFASSDPATPGDLFVQDIGGRPSQRTQLNADLVREVGLARPEEFSYKGADGWDIQGWIMRPTGTEGERPPAILEIHGGPAAMYGWSFFFEFQLLAAHGYAVLFVNPRGST